MSYGINFGTTADKYIDVNTVTCPEVWQIDLVLALNPIAYQLQRASNVGQTGDSGIWLPERVLAASQSVTLFASLNRRCTGMRVRSLNAGNSALFYLELIPPDELPPSGMDAPNSTRQGNPYPFVP